MVDCDPTGKLSPLCNLLHSGAAWICFKNDHTHPLSPFLFSRWPECNACNRFLYWGRGCVGTAGTFTDVQWRGNALFFSLRGRKKREPSIPFCSPKGGGTDQKTRTVRPLVRHFHPVQTLSSPRLLDRIIMAITPILNDSEESKMEP